MMRGRTLWLFYLFDWVELPLFDIDAFGFEPIFGYIEYKYLKGFHSHVAVASYVVSC
jgi:hypothetical protein